MKKLLGIVVLGLLWCNVGFAEKINSLNNINFEISDTYLLISEANIEELYKSAKDKVAKEAFGYWKNGITGNLELIFNKDLFLNWKKYNFKFDHILITSAPSNLTELKDVNKNEKAICFVKENQLKQLNGADKIKSHKCKLITNPKGASWSVYQSHENHNNQNIYVYSVVFKELEKSKVVHTILLSCGKHCEKYLPVFENLVESITFN